MKTTLLIPCSVLLLFFSLHLWAKDGDNLTESTVTNFPASLNPGEGKMSFPSSAISQQDPFWPIGYVPSNPTPVRVTTNFFSPNELAAPEPLIPKEPDWNSARKQLKVQGISRVGIDKQTGRATFFAVINGRVVEEGSIIEAVSPDFKYRWKVASIVEKNIVLNALEAQPR